MSKLVSQAELDAVVTQRLEWVARCASAFSHDIGNFVLFAEAADPDDSPADSSTLTPYRQLVEHFRSMLKSLNVWKYADAQRDRRLPVAEWWRVYGGMIRQFVPRSVRVELRSSAPASQTIQSEVLTRLASAMLIAFDAQVELLERISLHAAMDQGDDGVRLDISITPTPQRELLIPSLILQCAQENQSTIKATTGENGAVITFSLAAQPAPAANATKSA